MNPPLRAGSSVRSGAGTKIQLGRLLAQGGAGAIHAVNGHPSLLAKIYHQAEGLALYERKVQTMLQLPPALPSIVHEGVNAVQLAWPADSLYDRRGRFRGFLMPAVDVAATVELECVLQERQAKALGLPIGLGARVTLAANLSATVAELHRQRHYVVDLKPVNIRFHRRALYIALLDCDGFSIQGAEERFAAVQYTPDYLAPELQGQAMACGQEEAQDRFALAVIVFRLLHAGVHPYTGRPKHAGVPTDLPARIARGAYAHGLAPNPDMGPSPVSFPELMPFALRSAFDRAFSGAQQGRPTAAEWTTLLKPFATRASGLLRACAVDARHQHFRGLRCAACRRASLHVRAKQAQRSSASAATIRTHRKGQTYKRAVPTMPHPAPSVPVPSGGSFGFKLSLVSLVLTAFVGMCMAAPERERPTLSPYVQYDERERFLAERTTTPELPAGDTPEQGPIEQSDAAASDGASDAGVASETTGTSANSHAEQGSTSVRQRGLAQVHAVLDFAIKGDQGSYQRAMKELGELARKYARQQSKLNPLFVQAAQSRMAGLLARSTQSTARVSPQQLEEAALLAVLSEPSVHSWELLALSGVIEERSDCAVAGFAVVHLLTSDDERPLGHASSILWLIGANQDGPTRERAKVLWARGVMAATALGGRPYDVDIQQLAESPLPEAR